MEAQLLYCIITTTIVLYHHNNYCIVSSQLFCNILRLNVLDQDWFSDHGPITTALKINNIINLPNNKVNKTTDFKYIWNEEASKEFNKHAYNPINQRKMLDYIKKKIPLLKTRLLKN